MDRPAHTILCVDDEVLVLNAMKRLLRKENYRLLTARNGPEGLDLLSRNEVHLVICDQRMARMSGTDFMHRVKEVYPDVIRIILTGYTDVDAITDSINKGHIYKFFLKPWDDRNLKLEIRQALEQYDLIRANKALNQQVLQQNEALRAVNENLEAIIQERTRFLEVQNHALQISHAILEEHPLPIIGISREGMIVLINREARRMMGGDAAVELGESIHAYFPVKLEAAMDRALRSGRRQKTGSLELTVGRCVGELLPLNGRLAGRGVILSLRYRPEKRKPHPRHPEIRTWASGRTGLRHMEDDHDNAIYLQNV